MSIEHVYSKTALYLLVYLIQKNKYNIYIAIAFTLIRVPYRFINGKVYIILAMTLVGVANALMPFASSLIGASICFLITRMTLCALEVGK